MGGPATITASVRGLDPAAIPGAPSGLTGRISLEATAAASRADLAALEGTVAFPELQVAFNGLTLAQQEPTAIAIGSGVARVERFALSGSGGSLAASGTVGLTGSRPVDLDVDGSMAIAALSSLTNRVRTEGTARLTVTAPGMVTAPELNGTVDLADATLVSDEPNIAAENITARGQLAGSRLELTSPNADVNGGTLDGSGTVTSARERERHRPAVRGVATSPYDAPPISAVSASTLRDAPRRDILVPVSDERGQTADINFDEGLLAAINARPALDSLKRAIRCSNGSVLTRGRHGGASAGGEHLAHAEVDVDVRVGHAYEPGLTGRLNLREGAEITLNEQLTRPSARHHSWTNVASFLVDLLLSTTAGNYDVRIAVTGEPAD